MKQFRYPLIPLLLSVATFSIAAAVPKSPPLPDTIIPINPPAMKIAKAPTEEAPKQATARTWNLQDADILSVINEVSLETGKNFAVDPRVSGKISLVSSKPIKPSEVYQYFFRS